MAAWLVPQKCSHPRLIKTLGRSPIHATDSPLARAMAINRHLESLRSTFLLLIWASLLAPYCIGLMALVSYWAFPWMQLPERSCITLARRKWPRLGALSMPCCSAIGSVGQVTHSERLLASYILRSTSRFDYTHYLLPGECIRISHCLDNAF